MNHLDAKSRELQRFLDKLNTSFNSCDNQVLEDYSHLSRRELNIITYLGLHGAQQMRDLARQQVMPMSTLTGVMDRLREKSAITRQRSAKDKRIIKVRLTPVGENIFKAVQRRRLHLTENLMRRLKSEEQDILLLLSRKMRKDLSV